MTFCESLPYLMLARTPETFLLLLGLSRRRVGRDMRAQILALAVTVMSGVTACSIDVRHRGESRQAPLGTIVASDGSSNAAGDMVIYPRARRVENFRTDPTNVSFTGSFAEAHRSVVE